MHRRSRPDPCRPQDEEFTLRPASAGGFGAVEAALARMLRRVADRPERVAVFVIPTLHGGEEPNYYTQALVDREAGAWVEAVSNTFIIGESHLLDDDQHRLLAALGFDPPTERAPNHFFVQEHLVDWWYVASRMVQALEAVYGVDPRAELRVEISNVGPCSPFVSDDRDAEKDGEPEQVDADCTEQADDAEQVDAETEDV
ncbi:MAG: TY-Chap domain-containing protein [Iamia sp.]